MHRLPRHGPLTLCNKFWSVNVLLQHFKYPPIIRQCDLKDNIYPNPLKSLHQLTSSAWKPCSSPVVHLVSSPSSLLPGIVVLFYLIIYLNHSLIAMPSNGRHKRYYASDEDEGASSFAASRGDKTSSDPVFRSNHHSRRSEKVRTSSPSKAGMRDDTASSSSRTYHENDGRRTADDRHTYSPSKDRRSHGKRDDYDWRTRDLYNDPRDSYYSSSGKQQSDSYDYDRDYDDTNHDPSSWTPRKEGKDYGKSRWGQKEAQGSQKNDRGWAGIESNDRYNDSRNRDDLNPREWQRDNGWASRRGGNGNGSLNTVDSMPPERLQDSRDSYAGQQSSSQRQDSQRKKKKLKKQKTDKRPRDWKSAGDDTHLNNWTRRDSTDYSRKGQKSDYKRYRSPSRSPRSRSPAESYYSRRSSRGRSYSSDTPRRRRADSREPRSRSPYDRPGKGPPRRWSRSPSRSPYPRRHIRSPSRSPIRSPRRSPIRNPRSPWSPGSRRRHSRGRSLSTTSSMSRTPSRSPRERSRTVHRLPLATSAEDLRSKMGAKGPGDLPQRPDNRNGDGAGKRKDVSRYNMCKTP
ncbi:hypothetical protein BDY19DRAFT_482706 [Irpex rosettiformis]|uniref:Uncharacterized protein n=1 Tax=Irpex rosettiformis TaxID=378272 RepID=A0ACB8UDK8_9APHY|nr:hypothetical protein BDY19DRAFT_482706 [Irpex rosettiformis]